MSAEHDELRPADAPSSLYGPDGMPQFFADPAMDRFVAVLLNVTSELWIQTEKLASIEALLRERGSLDAADLSRLSERDADLRDEQAQAFLHRVFAPLRESA